MSEGNHATLVKEARTALRDDARNPLYIRTVHAYGYAFAGNVHELARGAHSIVVLPFENLTGDRDLDYLCDGIAENVTNAFSRLAHFRVMSSRTALRWKGSEAEPEAIGRELGADTVVHGRVRGRIGDLAIQVDAVAVGSNSQIWGNRLRCDGTQLFRIEEDVAAEVVDALQLRLSADDLSRLTHRYTSNPHAYDLYLRGRFHWNKRTVAGLQTAIEQFERATVADPEYALPHSGIADVFAVMGNRDFMPPRDAFAARCRRPLARSSSPRTLPKRTPPSVRLPRCITGTGTRREGSSAVPSSSVPATPLPISGMRCTSRDGACRWKPNSRWRRRSTSIRSPESA